MVYFPKHIEGSVAAADDIFPERADNFHHHFQVLCKECKSKIFRLFIGDKRTVKARCNGCATEALVYDLEQYSAATTSKGEEEFRETGSTDGSPVAVFVCYEHGELDADQEFDQNDTTWCNVFIRKSGKILQVFEDETA